MTAHFILPRNRATDTNFIVQPGAKLYFFAAGTSNPLTVYQDRGLTTPHAIPVVADSAGLFAPIYLPNGVAYKYELRDSADVLLGPPDDNCEGPFDASTITVAFAKPMAPIITKTASATLTSADMGKTVLGDTTSGSIALILPQAASVADKVLIVEKVAAAGTISLQAFAGDTIYGPNTSGANYQLAYQGEWVVLVPAAGTWRVLTSRPVAGSITSDLLSSSIAGSFMQAGTVVAWPVDGTLPSGYLEANGAAISRTTYSELFGVYSTKYGAGDGSTTFNLPDYRGQFLRGWANGSANDPDRAARTNRGDGTTGDNVGTKQADQTKSHTHTATSVVTDPGHLHLLVTSGTAKHGSAGVDYGTALYGSDGDVTSSVSTAQKNTNSGTTGITVATTNTATGGAQTNPTNVSVRWIIFAGQSIASGASAAISVLLNGYGTPSDSLGNNGDVYIDLSSGRYWGPKAAGTWVGLMINLTISGGRRFVWDTGTADADPGSGKIRVNNANLSLVTQMFVSETDNDGAGLAALFASWLTLGSAAARGILTIQKVTQTGTYANYLVSGSYVDGGAYDKLTLTYLASSGGFVSGDVVYITFTPHGAQGATGATGPNTGLDYVWSTSTSGDPTSGKVLVNNAAPASATQINISEANRNGASQSAFIATWDDSTTTASRAYIRIMDVSAPGTNFLEYRITGAMTDAGAYDTFPVTYIGGAGTLTNGMTVAIMVHITGDQGAGVTSVSPGAGTTSAVTAAAPGSAITTTGTLSTAQLVNAQVGTTYTVVDGDRAKLVTFSNASSIAVTLPQAGAASAFQSGWYAEFQNKGAGTVTITPTTSTIDGAASFSLSQAAGVKVVSDGTNYQVFRNIAAGVGGAAGAVQFMGTGNLQTGDAANLQFDNTNKTLGVGAAAATNAILTTGAGTTAKAARKLTSGTNLTTAVAGAEEYDGTVQYFTPVATNRGVQGLKHFLSLSATQNGTNVATAQTLFPGGGATQITLPGGTTYTFEGNFEIDTTGATSHSIGILFVGTATLTSIAYTAISGNSATAGTPSAASITRAAVATVTNITAAVAVATQNTIWIRGMVRINAGGTFIPQFQYSAAPGAVPTVSANSWFEMTPLGSGSVLNVGQWS